MSFFNHVGSTLVLHDSESPVNVGHCADPGCYWRDINYNAAIRQIEALIELSDECHQSIQVNLNNVKINKIFKKSRIVSTIATLLLSN